ncbi:hypothetical protein F4821DRAFT_255339 [Hypoxylon rubiginosum]|uniref:Uncharacterized protein n=1 Tax=Hypoxylon rubiginosum TaxID=110542 RepID=A0ACC0DE68_9PEZI|nr:hypothetical protein F4821DRAFT_255339 [Hypoxylon rubiginosum]
MATAAVGTPLPLPTHRRFLTSLIDSLTSIPVAGPQSAPGHNAIADGNPLKLIPPACRPLFTTLYALYPLILLPALDLLDRRLATRVFVRSPQQQQQDEQDGTAQAETGGAAKHLSPTLGLGLDQASSNDDDNGGNGNRQESDVATGSYSPAATADNNRSNTHTHTSSSGRNHSYYLVRSAQPQQTRRRGGGGGGGSNAAASGPRYVVRLDAWNCSCAAFAFAAFPRESNQPQQSYVIEPASSTSKKTRKKEGERETQTEKWEFGALSADGRDGSGIAGVPCCKHLLACLLAERWSDVLGGYVEERTVGREEGVGMVADI